MASYVFDPPAQVSAPIEGEDARFPVRRILCVGRNYAAHRREMGGDDRDPPFFFAKPADALVAPGADVAYPQATANLHHEIELIVAIGKGGADVAVDQALDMIFGYAVGVDLTRRDLQAAAREKMQPWEAAKGFDQSAPMSPVRRWAGSPPQGRIAISVNGQVKQEAVVADMIWNVPEIVSEASKLWRLAPGDLIFTGTPEGVGPLVRGDAVTGEVEGVGKLAFRVV
ncbi:fumarylacetoacetate hydrolase family protein [Phenylobacterium sp.]|uniref:fumarylacetoacetate hydrolase family protein n=1 Tax=Phenylobacterium sp. TaxID=1871053 RepID=UPI002DF2F452|nr:fumarylacetoacetate hydrolase family protein [Phenylobacterium sp.]